MRDAGWRNNPIKGALYSNATAGVGQANKLFGSLGGDLTKSNSQDLLGALIGGTNSLMPYYQTAPGGRGAIRASDTVTGKNQGPTSNAQPYTGDGASPEGYTQNFSNARDQLTNVINELMRRGATYEELGQLPVSGNWAQETLDAGGTPDVFYGLNKAKYDTEGGEIIGRNITRGPSTTSFVQSGEGVVPSGETPGGESIGGQMLQPGAATPQALFEAAMGAGAKGLDKDTHASGNITSMYGGPLWTALARMGGGSPQLQDLISQHFDPWVNARGMDASQLGTSLGPILKKLAFEQSANTGSGASAGGPAGF